MSWLSDGGAASDQFRQQFGVSDLSVVDERLPGLVGRAQAHQLPLKLRILSAICSLSHIGAVCGHARALGFADGSSCIDTPVTSSVPVTLDDHV